MQAERRQTFPRLLCQLWAGVECGAIAGLTILAWFSVHALSRGEFWWSKFNVAASWFYDIAVYHAGLSRVTLSGASLLIVFYCLAGALFALVRDGVLRRGWFPGVVVYAVGIHLLAAYFLWPSFGPFARLWYPWTATAPAHFVLFVMLMRYPTFYRRLLREFGDPGWLPAESRPRPSDLIEASSSSTSSESGGDASSTAEASKD